ncbi:response regulator transcription factor [bacterium]|nr:response regulator transcription factor [bacterium]
MLKVLIADDHPLVRSGVRATLEQSEGVQVLGEAHDYSEARTLAHKTRPDVIILDVQMPGGKAEEFVRSMHQELPQTKVLILSSHTEGPIVRGLMKAKVAGYMLKDEAPEHLLQAMRVLGGGATWFSHGIMDKLMEQHEEDPLVGLTPRERQVLGYVAEGRDNAGIAEELCLAEQTVRNVVSSIYSKIGVASRVEAVVWVRDRGLFEEQCA